MNLFASNIMHKLAAHRIKGWLFIVPSLLLVALNSPFFSNPLAFDDIYFFKEGEPERFLSSNSVFASRWWVYMTQALTFVFVGPEMHWFRIGNLAIHIGVTYVLYVFVQHLLLDLDDASVSTLKPESAALVATTLFAFHPLANFAQGYLTQRTILFATLFALVCWLFFWHGLKGSRAALWGSSAAFALSIFAKEHAIMVPAICFLLLVLFLRSGLRLQIKPHEILSVISVQCLIGIYVILRSKGILGTPYEPLTGEMMGDTLVLPMKDLYPLSVLNQAGLFFKYLVLWFLPHPDWISIDMREPFPESFGSWVLWGGALLYLAYGVIAAFLLSRGKAIGLAGLALLGAWILYFTEFSTVRLQEPFVLYRSYIWMPLLFILIALGIRRLRTKLVFTFFPMFLIFFAALSYDRLNVLSHPYFIWDEAARLYEKKRSNEGNVLGGHRIYYNRGTTLLNERIMDAAMEDFDRALALNPNYLAAYHQKGVIHLEKKEWHLARANFERAINLKPNIRSWLGRGRALEEAGDKEQARISFIAACTLGSKKGCNKAGVSFNEIRNAKGNRSGQQAERRPG